MVGDWVKAQDLIFPYCSAVASAFVGRRFLLETFGGDANCL